MNFDYTKGEGLEDYEGTYHGISGALLVHIYILMTGVIFHFYL